MKGTMKLWGNHFKTHLNTRHPYQEDALDSISEAPLYTEEQLTLRAEEIKKAIGDFNYRKVPGGSDRINSRSA